MARTKRLVVTVLSILYLILPTAIAGSMLLKIHLYSLPIPTPLNILTSVLPIIAGLALGILTGIQERGQAQNQARSSPLASRSYLLTMPLLIIYETAVGTLIGTHIGPKNTLTCGLDERWQWLFSQKQGDAIRTIQDAFECCGLHSPVDRAWPFPGHDAGVDACQVRYGRQRSCFEQWRVEEQRIAGWMLVAVVLVVLWMILVVLWQDRNTPWKPRYESDDESHDSSSRHSPCGRRGSRGSAPWHSSEP